MKNLVTIYLSIALLVFCQNKLEAEATYSQPIEGIELPIGNKLEWQTISEFDVATFVVEKSIDGVNYIELGSVNGAGYSLIDNAYHFMDIGTSDTKNYYRLKEISSEGSIGHSLPTLVEKKMVNNINIVAFTSTSCAKNFQITADIFREANIVCTLQEFSGKVLQSFDKTTVNGLNNIVFSLEDVAPGNYQVKITLDEEVETIVINRVKDEKSGRPAVATTKKEMQGRQ
jgi:hypothetical protein